MQRVYVVGFDGATWRFIKPLVEKGQMPSFERLMKEGAHGELTSTIPFQSAAAWVTCMTGQNSGKHGVYMFQDYDAASYSYVGRTANSRYFSGQTIFDVVGEMGGRVTAVRVPMTYPAWPVKGVMVSGFPTPGDTPESFYPVELRQEVGTIGQAEPPDFRLLSTEEQIRTLEAQMDRMSELISRLMDREHDLFMVVHRIPDPVHHFFIKFVDPRTPAYDPEEARRWGDAVDRFYRRMDDALGETLARLGEEDTIFVISDHGGAITPPRQLNLNVWLAQRGLLTPKEQATSVPERIYALNQKLLPARVRALLRRRAPKGVQGGLRQMWKGLQQIDFSRTRAYHFPMKCPPLAGIVINLQGRQPQGIVPPEEYEALRGQIMRDVAELRDPRTDEPIVARVFTREELYQGPYVERAPDIIVWCHDMYKEGPLAQGPIVGQVPFDELVQVPGSHDEKGILLAKGPGVRPGLALEGARLIDVPPTVLHAMGLAVPSDMDGRVLTELFVEGARGVASVDLSLARQSEESYLSEDEEQMIKDKLKGWGYL
ncbi:MAG: alkaline phosphatase family protein [Chloroflexi bacterium]|nr:alkaline phosphatase family protein [Chloroflexota bacterium]